MDKQMIEKMARDLCPHNADGKCYYETTEISACDGECEFCWAAGVVGIEIVKRMAEAFKIKFSYDKDKCKVIDEICEEFTEEDNGKSNKP